MTDECISPLRRRMIEDKTVRNFVPKTQSDNGRALEREDVRGDGLPKDGVMANHSLRRAYATAATNAGVDEDTVGKLLNHGGRSITSRYIKTSHLGRMLAGAQEDISAHLVKALGSPPGLA